MFLSLAYDVFATIIPMFSVAASYAVGEGSDGHEAFSYGADDEIDHVACAKFIQQVLPVGIDRVGRDE